MINTKAIKRRMIDYDYTNSELADKIGVSQSYMSGVINGSKPLTLGMAEKLQEALNIYNDDFAYYFLSGAEEQCK